MKELIKEVVKKILKESYQQELLDLILDKVSKYGMKSLNSHEKAILNNISKNNKNYLSDWDLILEFLDIHIGKLTGDSYISNKIGKRVSGIKYFNRTLGFLFDLEVDSEVLGLKKKQNTLYASDEISQLLKDNFNINSEDIKKIVKAWFERETSMPVSDLDFFLTNKN